jgi:indolepyruvate ferredoxin oxidoreductase
MAAADLIIGCDPIVTAGKETMLRMREGRTHVALNAQHAHGRLREERQLAEPGRGLCVADIARPWARPAWGTFNADAAATKLMGDSIYVNPMMLGYAWQKGWIPLGRDSCCAPSSSTRWRWTTTRPPLNGAGVPRTTGPRVEKLLSPAQVLQFKKRETVESLVARRVEFLTAYQDAAYAAQYQAFVEKVRLRRPRWQDHADRKRGALPVQADGLQGRIRGGAPAHRYRVPRQDQRMFEGDFKLNYHMAPPLMAKRNDKGELHQANSARPC